ncbi:hypothetical protein TcWFU_001474 [Taenia crassiceps]|uniref:Uncharacterized protein n=1 Tax=Taenia crassiceps TaxID=6207 RepID=A0ABR4Q141_9CEST
MAMRHGTFPPPPPLPPLPSPTKSTVTCNPASMPPTKGIDLRASRNSDAAIWKAGLDVSKGELEVVFGELKPDQLANKVKSKFPDPNRSIIIPSHQQPGNRGDNNVTKLKTASGMPFAGALNSSRNQLPGIKNSRFKEYLQRYFPRENVIMQPLENVIRSMAAEGRIVCNPPVITWDAQRDHSPFRLSAHEQAICTPANATLPPSYQEVSEAKLQQKRFKGGRKLHQSRKDVSEQASVSATRADTDKGGGQLQSKTPKSYCSTTVPNYTCEKVAKTIGVSSCKAPNDSERGNKSLAEKSSTPNAFNCDHRCRSRAWSVLSVNLSPVRCQRSVRQKCMSQMEIARPQEKKSQACVSSSACWLCLHTHRYHHRHRHHHQYRQQCQTQSEAVSKQTDKAMVSLKATPTSTTEGDTRRKTLTITLLPTVASRLEGKKGNNASEMANEASVIGGVCQKLKKCVASLQNRILDSLLPSLVVMGNFAESAHRDEFKRRHHFKNLQTIVLDTAFAETLKNFALTQPSEQTGGSRGREATVPQPNCPCLWKTLRKGFRLFHGGGEVNS